MKNIQGFAVAATAMLLFGGSAFADVLVVDPAGGGDFLDLEAAVAVAVDGDVIEFVDGAHDVAGVFIQSSVTLRSASGNATSCTIRGSGNSGVLFGVMGSNSFVGVQYLGFFEPLLYFSNCDYQIQGCRFNFVNDLGREIGIWIEGASGTIENSTVEGWTVKIDQSPSIIVRSCQFNNSRFQKGPSPFGLWGEFILQDCSFAGFSPVAINDASRIEVDRCTFSENEVLEENQIWALLSVGAGQISVTSCLFSDNQLGSVCALSVAGNALDGEILVENCTFSNNTSMGDTAGLLAFGWPNLNCENVDFSGNTAPNGSPDAYVVEGCEVHFNCCEIDEANIGGDGQANITFDGCTVPTRKLGFGDLKALYR